MQDNQIENLIQQLVCVKDTQIRLRSASQQIQQLFIQIQSIKVAKQTVSKVDLPTPSDIKKQLNQESILQTMHSFKQKIILQQVQQAFMQYQKIIALIRVNQVNPAHKFQVDFLYDLFLNMIIQKAIQGCKISQKILSLNNKHQLLIQSFFRSRILKFKSFLKRQLNRVVLLDEQCVIRCAEQAVQSTIDSIKQFKVAFKIILQKQPNMNIYGSQFIQQMKDLLVSHLQGLLIVEEKQIQTQLRKILQNKLSEAQLQGIKFNI